MNLGRGAARPARTSAILKVVVAIACAAVAADSALAATFNPLLPHLANQFDLTKSQVGLIAAAHPVGVVLAAVPGGLLATRYGPRNLVITAALVLVVACALLATATGPLTLAVGRLFQGSAGALAWCGAFSWVVGAAPPRKRGQLIGIVLSAATGGALAGPLLAILGAMTSPQLIFAVMALPGLAVCIASSRLPQPSHAPSPCPASIWTMANRQVAAGAALLWLVGLSYGVTIVLGTTRLDRLGASTAQISATLITASAVQIAMNPLAGRLADRFSPLFPIRIGLSVLAVVLFLFSVPQQLAPQSIVIVLCLASSSMVWGPSMSLLAEAGARNHLGMVFAIVNVSWAAGSATGTAGSGITAAHLGDGVPTSVAAVLMVTAVCPFLLVQLYQRTRGMAGSDT